MGVKTLRTPALLGLLLLLLTACEMRTWVDIDLTNPNAGEVVMTIGFDEQFRQFLEDAGGPGDIFGEIETRAGEGWTVAPFADEGIEGVTMTRSFSSLDEMARVLQEAPDLGPNMDGASAPMVQGLSVVDTGSTIRFEGSIPSVGGEEFQGFNPEEALGIIDFDARVSVAFPGEVIEHNGELNGRTVTWRFFENDFTGVEMFAEAKKGGGISPVVIGAIVLALVVAGVVAYRVLGSRTRQDGQDGVQPAPSAGEGGDPQPLSL